MDISFYQQFNLQSIINPYRFKLKNIILYPQTSEKVFTNNEILIHICGFLEEKDILILMCVNKYLSKLAENIPKLEIRLLKYQLKTANNKLNEQKNKQSSRSQGNNGFPFLISQDQLQLKGTAGLSTFFKLLNGKKPELSKSKLECQNQGEEPVFHMNIPPQFLKDVEHLQEKNKQEAEDNFFSYNSMKNGTIDSDTKLILELKKEIYDCLREDYEVKQSNNKLKVIPKLLFTNPQKNTEEYVKAQLEWIEVKSELKDKTGKILKKTGKMLCPAVHVKKIINKFKKNDQSCSQ
ncbi:hypothetical protein ABPG72_005280 [Tetrahymena utriculariae]